VGGGDTSVTEARNVLGMISGMGRWKITRDRTPGFLVPDLRVTEKRPEPQVLEGRLRM
jgi:hypothetical protein